MAREGVPMEKININGYEVEKTSLNEALYSTADLVFQFGYRTKFRGCEAVCDGGLSALENAFWALQRAGCKMNKNGTIQVKSLLKFMKELER